MTSFPGSPFSVRNGASTTTWWLGGEATAPHRSVRAQRIQVEQLQAVPHNYTHCCEKHEGMRELSLIHQTVHASAQPKSSPPTNALACNT